MPRRRMHHETRLIHDPALDMRLERLASDEDVAIPYRARRQVVAESEDTGD